MEFIDICTYRTFSRVDVHAGMDFRFAGVLVPDQILFEVIFGIVHVLDHAPKFNKLSMSQLIERGRIEAWNLSQIGIL